MKYLIHIDIYVGGVAALGYSEGIMNLDSVLEIGQSLPLDIGRDVSSAGIDAPDVIRVSDVIIPPDVPGNEGIASILVCDDVVLPSREHASELMRILSEKYGLKEVFF